MADHDEMLVEHQKTWNGFLKVTFLGSAVIIVILALMGIFLV